MSNWQMFSYTGLSEKALLVGIFNATSGFPIGAQNWFLSQKCNNVKQVLERTMLKLSQVFFDHIPSYGYPRLWTPLSQVLVVSIGLFRI